MRSYNSRVLDQMLCQLALVLTREKILNQADWICMLKHGIHTKKCKGIWFNTLSKRNTSGNQYPQELEHHQLSRSPFIYPSQVTALSFPRITNILTSELVLLVFELHCNEIIQNVLLCVGLLSLCL